MKQIYIEKQAKDQVHQNIRNANSEVQHSIIRERPNSDFLNIFLIQNKGKGPPGDIRHPDHPPDNKAGPPDINPVNPDGVRDQKPDRIETSGDQILKNPSEGRSLSVRLSSRRSLSKGDINFNTEIQRFNKYRNSNFLQTLNFTNMKKQILFLAFFVLAALVSITDTYGQTLNPETDALDAAATYCTPAIALTCGAGDPLHPAPGIAYDYTITSSSAGKVHWFVTDDANIRTTTGTTTNIDLGDGTGDYILSSNSIYNNTGTNSLTVNITWKSFDGIANDVLLVAYNVDVNGCTDNIEVYRIEPKYAFTLDIAGIADDGIAGGTVSECVAPIVSASYDGTNLNVDYGTNYVFFAVNAANWQTSWMPDDFAVKTSGTSSVTIEGWAYPDEADTGGAWNVVGTDQVDAAHYTTYVDNGFIGDQGACIIVKVRVDHATQTENIADEIINLTVNGEMIDPELNTYNGNYPDLDEPASGPDCIDDLTTDNADYTITPRPDINEGAPTPFENKVPRD